MNARRCTTHHHACDCREQHFRLMQQDNSWAEEKLSDMAIELADLKQQLAELREAAREFFNKEMGGAVEAYAAKDRLRRTVQKEERDVF